MIKMMCRAFIEYKISSPYLHVLAAGTEQTESDVVPQIPYLSRLLAQLQITPASRLQLAIEPLAVIERLARTVLAALDSLTGINPDVVGQFTFRILAQESAGFPSAGKAVLGGHALNVGC